MLVFMLWNITSPYVAFLSLTPSFRANLHLHGIMLTVSTFSILTFILTYNIEQFMRRKFVAATTMQLQKQRFENEKNRTQTLLMNIIPEHFISLLKDGSTNGLYTRPYGTMSVLQSNMVSFTEYASSVDSKSIVELLHTMFSKFDEIATQYELEKVKTIGDTYLVVSYMHSDNGARIVTMGMEMLNSIEEINKQFNWKIKIRIGCCTDRATLAVLGDTKNKYATNIEYLTHFI